MTHADTVRQRTGAQRRRFRPIAATLLVAALLIGASPAAADEYEADRTGHPLRVLAYVVHPIGVILDRLIIRPFHWLGSYEPIRTLFGHEED